MNVSFADVAWLKSGPVARLLGLLDGDGEEARVVGGAVRNALLHAPIQEFDVATTALPEEVNRRVLAAGFKTIPTGIEHGTVTALIEGTPIEVTTLRQDVETFGRKAKVAFGRDWETDAKRRDFTMNALSVSSDGKIHDYVGGLADLKNHHVRFIGDPDARIAEDYLRILRFFRFHAAYGEGALDQAGLRACIVGRVGLQNLSRERVRTELLKLLIAPHAVAALVAMAESGLLIGLLGGVPQLASFANMVKVEIASHVAPDAVRRLGALGVFLTEDADRLMQRLRLSNAEHERLHAMGEHWWRVKPSDDLNARASLYRLGPERFIDKAAVAWTRSPQGDKDAAWQNLIALPKNWTPPVFPLTAADFMRRKLAKGPLLGQALRIAEAAWMAADFPEEQVALAAIADNAVKHVLASAVDKS